MGGVVEVDGAYLGGKVRLENLVEDRKDRRLAENQSGKRRCVVVMHDGAAAMRIYPFFRHFRKDLAPAGIPSTPPRFVPTQDSSSLAMF
jgi:hypothetical protein